MIYILSYHSSQQLHLLYIPSCNIFYFAQNKNYYESKTGYKKQKIASLNSYESKKIDCINIEGYEELSIDNFSITNISVGVGGSGLYTGLINPGKLYVVSYDSGTGVVTISQARSTASGSAGSAYSYYNYDLYVIY